MKYHKLRIAWSVGWGVAAALLIVLWARSYSNGPGEGYPPAPFNICCRSIDGVVLALKLPAQTVTQQPLSRFSSFSFGDFDSKPIDIGPTHTWTGFLIDWHSTSFWWLQFPYWFLVTISATFAAGPWVRQMKWRFSLRTLLIGMTVVAVGLGLAIWAVK